MKPVKLFSGHYRAKKSTSTRKIIGFKLSVLCWHLFLMPSGWACAESTFTFSLFHISRLHPYANICKNALDPCIINIDLPQVNLIRFLTSRYSKRWEATDRTSEQEKLAFKQTGMNVYLPHTNEYLFFKGKLHQTVDFSWRTNKHLVVVIQQTFSPLTKPRQHG